MWVRRPGFLIAAVCCSSQRAQGEKPRAYIQDIGGGNRKAIGPTGIRSLRVSPDGQTIAASSPNGPILFSSDGTQVRRCPGTELGDSPIQWSTDGRSVFVSRTGRVTTQIARIELATARRTLLYELAARDPAGASSPVGVCLTPDGKSYAYGLQRVFDDLYLVEGLK